MMKRRYEDWFNEHDIGDCFYTLMTYVGAVKMEIVSKHEGYKSMVVKSVGEFDGYTQQINEEIYNRMYEFEGNGLFETEEDAEEFYLKREDRIKNNFIEEYSKDKNKFIEDMVRKAYEKECDPEYGNFAEAQGIEEVARGFGIIV